VTDWAAGMTLGELEDFRVWNDGWWEAHFHEVQAANVVVKFIRRFAPDDSARQGTPGDPLGVDRATFRAASGESALARPGRPPGAS
jgi:hypothetical protein